MGTWSAHGRYLANVHVTDWIYIYICAKFRVTENRCVLFNSLTYVYLALLPEHWSLYAKVDSTLTYIYIYIYIYIYLEREKRDGENNRDYTFIPESIVSVVFHISIYITLHFYVSSIVQRKNQNTDFKYIHTYIYIYIYIYIFIYVFYFSFIFHIFKIILITFTFDYRDSVNLST